MANLAVCVDDVGLAEGAADAVIELGRLGHITAASCVSNGHLWRRDALRLSSLARQIAHVELGLHFNLTDGAPASRSLARHWPTLPRLGRLIATAHLRRLPLAALRDEWRAQLDAFRERLGCDPHFVDGHQHVHHLPGVRDVVLDGIVGWARQPAVRSTGCVMGPGSWFKRRVIEATGGRALARELDARGVARNETLFGTYSLEPVDYRRLVTRWLAGMPEEGALLYCHPAIVTAAEASGAGALRENDDEIAAARSSEQAYLSSEDFALDLAVAGITLGPTWAHAPGRRRPTGG